MQEALFDRIISQIEKKIEYMIAADRSGAEIAQTLSVLWQYFKRNPGSDETVKLCDMLHIARDGITKRIMITDYKGTIEFRWKGLRANESPLKYPLKSCKRRVSLDENVTILEFKAAYPEVWEYSATIFQENGRYAGKYSSESRQKGESQKHQGKIFNISIANTPTTVIIKGDWIEATWEWDTTIILEKIHEFEVEE